MIRLDKSGVGHMDRWAIISIDGKTCDEALYRKRKSAVFWRGKAEKDNA